MQNRIEPPDIRSKTVDTVIFKPIRRLFKKPLTHDILDKHTNIAWDLDDTLINGPTSWFWRRWIRDNHENRKFAILTFRTAETEGERKAIINNIYSLIEDCKDPLKREWFNDVLLINPKIWNSWITVPKIFENLLSEEELTDYGRRKSNDYDIKKIIDANIAVRAWKASECHRLGYTILVEDREVFCRAACEIFGIEFLRSIPPKKA